MLTRSKQIQAIADLAAGLPVTIPLEQMGYPFDYLYMVVQRAPAGMGRNTLTMVKLETDDSRVAELIDDILDAEPGHRPEFKSLADVGANLQPIDWLWHGWIPRGFITILAAYGGVGKTYLALYLAKCIIHELPAPDGQALRRARRNNVIYIDAEDFIVGLNQRAKVWGMNTDHLYPYTKPSRLMFDLNDIDVQDRLVDMVDQLEPELIVIDSLSTIHTKGEGKKEDVNPILLFLHDLAQYANCGLVLIHHPRKPLAGGLPTRIAMHDLSGSGQLTIIPRCIIGMSIVGDSLNGPREIQVLKNNSTQYPDSLGMQLLPSDHPDVARLKFGKLSDFLPEAEMTDVEIAAEWLKATLEDGGPTHYKKLAQLIFEKYGFNETTLQRGRKRLGAEVVDTIKPHAKDNKWALAGQMAQTTETTAEADVETTAAWLLEVLKDEPRSFVDLEPQAAAEIGASKSTLIRARKSLGDRIVDTIGPGKRRNMWALMR